jgi:hypothetical protein
VTVSYDGTSGRRLSLARYRPGPFKSAAYVALVAPDGSRIYVAGVAGPSPSEDYVTIAYSVP